MQYLDDLTVAGNDATLWRWLPTAHYRPGSMSAFIKSGMHAQAKRLALCFAIMDAATGKAVGSTRYHHIDVEHRRLEIGVTWIGPAYQRSYVNTETKLIQLWYAFEILNCRRVELKADVENLKSRTAILRLGATEEGRFRKHMLYPDGRNRDNVYYSIIDDEWKQIREGLERKLGYAVSPSFKAVCGHQ